MRPKRHLDHTGPHNYVDGLVDLLRYVKPRSVLEIGCYNGVSTTAMAMLVDRVVCVEVDPRPRLLDLPIRFPNVEIIEGASPEALSRFSEGEFDLAYIDGSHELADVVADIWACRKVARRLSGHDYGVPPLGLPGVKAAVLQLLGEPEIVFCDSSWLARR